MQSKIINAFRKLWINNLHSRAANAKIWRKCLVGGLNGYTWLLSWLLLLLYIFFKAVDTARVAQTNNFFFSSPSSLYPPASGVYSNSNLFYWVRIALRLPIIAKMLSINCFVLPIEQQQQHCTIIIIIRIILQLDHTAYTVCEIINQMPIPSRTERWAAVANHSNNNNKNMSFN